MRVPRGETARGMHAKRRIGAMQSVVRPGLAASRRGRSPQSGKVAPAAVLTAAGEMLY